MSGRRLSVGEREVKGFEVCDTHRAGSHSPHFVATPSPRRFFGGCLWTIEEPRCGGRRGSADIRCFGPTSETNRSYLRRVPATARCETRSIRAAGYSCIDGPAGSCEPAKGHTHQRGSSRRRRREQRGFRSLQDPTRRLAGNSRETFEELIE